MSETVNFTINIGGNAYTGIAEIAAEVLTTAMNQYGVSLLIEGFFCFK